mmetsp:Transcript_33302/g.72686  ORF Transcript_33302/g.72686 Transcript_33302/m.72686 type:complete len:388 (-) Transcript_33302:783-1946(-)
MGPPEHPPWRRGERRKELRRRAPRLGHVDGAAEELHAAVVEVVEDVARRGSGAGAGGGALARGGARERGLPAARDLPGGAVDAVRVAARVPDGLLVWKGDTQQLAQRNERCRHQPPAQDPLGRGAELRRTARLPPPLQGGGCPGGSARAESRGAGDLAGGVPGGTGRGAESARGRGVCLQRRAPLLGRAPRRAARAEGGEGLPEEQLRGGPGRPRGAADCLRPGALGSPGGLPRRPAGGHAAARLHPPLRGAPAHPAGRHGARGGLRRLRRHVQLPPARSHDLRGARPPEDGAGAEEARPHRGRAARPDAPRKPRRPGQGQERPEEGEAGQPPGARRGKGARRYGPADPPLPARLVRDARRAQPGGVAPARRLGADGRAHGARGRGD